MASILTDVKEDLGYAEADADFDKVITRHINTAIFVLRSLGVGPSTGFSVTGPSQTWEAYLGDKLPLLEPVKTYLSTKVRIYFDSPQSGVLTEALERTVKELEWRINAEAEALEA